MDDLLDVLAARSGIVCTVGAGGKKTTLYRLAEQHTGRVGLTSTVPTAHFPRTLAARVIVTGADAMTTAVVEAASAHRVVAFAHPSEKRARYGGLARQAVSEIHRAAGFDLTLVKADGARMRWIKAPAASEPVIPDGATTVIPLVSARAIGAPLTEETAHRLDRVEAVTGARRGELLSPTHIARLLADPDGALKGVGDATVVPVINMVDDAEREAGAAEAARIALALTDRFDRVVLTSMRRPDPLVRAVGR